MLVIGLTYFQVVAGQSRHPRWVQPAVARWPGEVEAAVPDLAVAFELASADRGDGVGEITQLPPRYADCSLDEKVVPENKVEAVEAVLLAVAGEVVQVNRIHEKEEFGFNVLRAALVPDVDEAVFNEIHVPSWKDDGADGVALSIEASKPGRKLCCALDGTGVPALPKETAGHPGKDGGRAGTRGHARRPLGCA